MVNIKDFVKRLEKVLEYYNLSATAFAEKIDFNRSTISHLLSGRNKPSLEFVLKLLKEFPEVEMNWLLFGKGNFPSTSENLTEKVTHKRKQSNISANPVDLFSETNLPESKEDISPEMKIAQNKNYETEIDKIVIFYNDGSFNVYQN
jgi:plasmid maintenance system antidote protein VapI